MALESTGRHDFEFCSVLYNFFDLGQGNLTSEAFPHVKWHEHLATMNVILKCTEDHFICQFGTLTVAS